MKTAVISLPDDVFAAAELLVQRLEIDRSELYATALREYLARRGDDAITTALDRVYAEPENRPDSAAIDAGNRTLQRTEW